MIVETTDNRLWRVETSTATHHHCVCVKRAKGGFVDTAKATRRLVLHAHVLRVVA